MAPLVAIAICAVIGFLIYGIIGLIAGAAAGWVISMLIGIAADAWSGGLLPRKERRRVALVFYMDNQPTVDSYMQNMTEEEKLRLIERLIERVFRRATVAAPLVSKPMGMSPPEITEAAMQEAAEEQDPKVREIILLLKDHILRTMY